jgi:AbrB family looped-hinge helix DNA binding protein
MATVTSKGQVTLPLEIRKLLGVTAGDKVAFSVHDDGTVEVRLPRFPDIASVAGIAGSLPKPMEWHEMLDIARHDRLARPE